MIIATDNEKHKPKNTIEIEITNNDIVLTDDYNPIDSLISTEYQDQ